MKQPKYPSKPSTAFTEGAPTRPRPRPHPHPHPRLKYCYMPNQNVFNMFYIISYKNLEDNK
jgi:hypothetical protein